MTMSPSPQTKPRRFFTCRRHPSEPVTGICASCLRERLAVFDSSGHPESSYSTTGAASESIIPPTSAGLGGGSRTFAVASSSIRSELRRCRSYSSCKSGACPGVSEPRRKSCDVRVRNSLWHHFSLTRGTELESKNRGFSGVTGSMLESRGDVQNRDKVRVSEDTSGQNISFNQPCVEEELKTMKEHIELECHSSRRKHTGRDLRDIAGSFWLAASVFSQRLPKFRLKQRMKKRHGGGGDNLSRAEKLNGRQLRETQSEVGYYGHGRGSCDTDPRFSFDAGRMSLDDPRFSIDEPRASWDGYMTVKPIPQLPAMLSVIENVTVLPINRPENGISVEEQMNSIDGENETTTCGSTPAQNRDYCSDSSSSQRQNSCDCSSPTINDALHRMNSELRDRDTRGSDFNSHKYDHRDSPIEFKKSGGWQKVWKILGFMHRLTDTKQGDDEGRDTGLIGDCSEIQNGVVNGASSGKLVRSGSCVSSGMGSYNPSSSRVAEIKGYGKKSGKEFALERNWSSRYSPNDFENGLLRFHLTPSWSCRRKSGRRRSRLRNSSHAFARSVLRMNWS